MHTYLIDLLECPACQGALEWEVAERVGDRVEQAEARCRECGADYPVLEGIGFFLTPDLPRRDLWEQVDSRLARYLREHPEAERRLMGSPIHELGPADLFYRALVLEERGAYEAARGLLERANRGTYTEEYLACLESQIEHVLQGLAGSREPVVDLASGRCYLVERIVRQVERPVVATDFSPAVLRRNRARLESRGLYDRVSLLAFDARRTPFRDRSVGTMTTHLGLPNIQEPGALLGELRRVVSGEFLAVCLFYPEDDQVNAAALKGAGVSSLVFRDSAVAGFIEAGWQVEIASRCLARAEPTPTSEVLEGAGIDAFPVHETTLEMCVLVAR
jgi:uncharacterized protein YbaR (Trm112 family)